MNTLHQAPSANQLPHRWTQTHHPRDIGQGNRASCMTQREDRIERVRQILACVYPHIGRIWNDCALIGQIKSVSPDRIERIVELEAILSERCASFIDAELPWRLEQETEKVLTITDAQMCCRHTDKWVPLQCLEKSLQIGPDVFNAAVEFVTEAIVMDKEFREAYRHAV